MPRKLRPGKGRRAVGWSLEYLHPLLDVLTLQAGRLRPDHHNPRVRIRTMEDAREAWRANRDLLMRMCQCHIEKPCCRDHALRYSPGTRPWGWWKFDMGYDDSPPDREQSAELERLGLLTEEERRLLAGPPPEPGHVIDFPEADEDDADDEGTEA